MKKIHKWTKLTGRRKYWIGGVITAIIRLVIKLLAAYGYTRIFDMMGVYGGIWIKILSWITAYWLASKVGSFINWMLLPEETRYDPDMKQEDFEWSEIRELFHCMKQLLFYTTDEDRPS